MNKSGLVIFDLDGTLLDTSPGIIHSIKQTVEFFKLDNLSEEAYSMFIGPPIEISFKSHYDMGDDMVTNCANYFRKIYSGQNLFEATPYPGIYDVFEKLDKLSIKIGVGTYKREKYAISLLKHFGFNRYTDNMYGSDEDGSLTKKDIIEKCIKHANIQNRETVYMVGDTSYDLIAANECGIKFIGVTYGFGFKEGENMIKSPVELIDKLIWK